MLCAVWANAQNAPPKRPRTPAEARAARLVEQRQELEAELVQGLPAIDELIASGKPDGPDHRIQSRLGQLANIDGRPTKALEFVAPFTQSRDDFQLAHTDCWLVVAQAKLLLAGFKPNYDNSAMSMQDLHLFTLPIDSEPVMPKLTEKQRTLAHEALVIADWLAGQTNGLNQMEAVEVCARVLAMQGEYRRSIDTYRFAQRVAQPEHVSQGAIDLYAGKRGELNQQVAHVQRLWDIQGSKSRKACHRELKRCNV